MNGRLRQRPLSGWLWAAGQGTVDAITVDAILAHPVLAAAERALHAGILADLGGELGAAGRDRMRERFVTAARYEWTFWDAAYRRETWPV